MEPPKPCPQEHMSLGGFLACVPCPEGKCFRGGATSHDRAVANTRLSYLYMASRSLSSIRPACGYLHPGFACPEGTAVPKKLRPGFYHGISVEGNDLRKSTRAAIPCPEGFYCAGGSASPVPCLPGYVSNKGASECIPCPAGFKCKTGRASDLEVNYHGLTLILNRTLGHSESCS